MKKKTLLTITLAILILTTVFLSNLFAFGPKIGGKWWYRADVKDKLQLTPDQISKINKIWIEHRKRIIDIRGDMEKAYLDLENLMSQPTVDGEQAFKLAETLAQLQARQTEDRIKMSIEIRLEISVEQFEKLKSLRREFTRMLREKGPRRPEGRNGPGPN